MYSFEEIVAVNKQEMEKRGEGDLFAIKKPDKLRKIVFLSSSKYEHIKDVRARVIKKSGVSNSRHYFPATL